MNEQFGKIRSCTRYGVGAIHESPACLDQESVDLPAKIGGRFNSRPYIGKRFLFLGVGRR